ncbi:hypothetical protein HDU98_009212 [Podochytrium sp. JEL0797]|nr:hypothetical protein HDU98_009212 [Podochytrium sp. JEL0797]
MSFSPELAPFLQEYGRLRNFILSNNTAANELRDHLDLLDTLQKQLNATSRHETDLKAAIAKERSHLNKLGKFSFTQIGAKLKGKEKYRSEVSGTQATLFQDEQELTHDQELLADLDSQIAAMEAQAVELRGKANLLESNQKELMEVLDTAFRVAQEGGVSGPEFTKDAQFGYQLSEIVTAMQQQRAEKLQFSLASTELHLALQSVQACLYHINSALQSAQTDLYFRNEFSEWNEYNQANAGSDAARSAGLHISRAKQHLPNHLPDSLGLVNFQGLDAFGTLWFDNIFSDLQNIQYLQSVAVKMNQTNSNLQSITVWVDSSLRGFDSSLKENEMRRLAVARSSLDHRVASFEKGLFELGGVRNSGKGEKCEKSFAGGGRVENSRDLIPDSMFAQFA